MCRFCALTLNNIFEEIAPEAGKKPDAFSNFFKSRDSLSIHEQKFPPEKGIEKTFFIIPHKQNNLLRHQEGWIEAIQKNLSEERQTAIYQSLAIFGQGGIGKTLMAIEYAWGGENRRVYRWNFNPILFPYIKVSGVRNDAQRRWQGLDELEQIRLREHYRFVNDTDQIFDKKVVKK